MNMKHLIIAALAPWLMISNVQAAGSHQGGHQGERHGIIRMSTLAGQPGHPDDVDRTIMVSAEDAMIFYVNEQLKVEDGETIRFVVTNDGSIEHEFAIGTKEEHAEHGAMMMKNPGMDHGPAGNAMAMQPGETKELIWTFEKAWQVQVACNIPGHYEAGMHKQVVFSE
ncbi:cupredoxin domain-containing protein [Hahella ganghwensis]|uniref:cupredoxin domain-containing protein n=1 Tax=Hahella ganghwensis TaxID=286420 RepID=UPI0003602579|nr:plastocyanin/azurin family copper-binding protein [Hahella ganghwensis]